MRGRPRVFKDPRQIAVCIEADWHEHLAGGMLAAYRREHPHARVSDLLRAIVQKAIGEHVAARPEQQRQQVRRRLEIRRLAVAIASAGDDKIEVHARKLAALM